MRIIIVSLFFILIIISQMNTIVDIDLWWILKTGEFITTNLNVPHIDIFSYTLGNKEWVDHEWLSQVIFYTIFKKFGWLGVNILKALTISSCFFISLFLIYSKYKKIFFTLFIALLSVLAFGYRSFARPEIFSYLLLCVFFYIMEKEKKIFILPFLQILWVNLHGYFVLGPLLILLYSASKWLSGDKGRARELAIVFIMATLTCFINPNFIRGALYPFKLLLNMFLEQDMRLNIAELGMPIKSNFGRYIFLWVLAILSSVTFLLNIRKVKIEHILLYAISFFAAYMLLRNVAIFIFLAIPLASINLNETSLTKNIPEKKYYPLLILATCFLIYFFASNRYYAFTGQLIMRKTGNEFSKLLTPFGACDFLKKNHIEGRIFNTFEFGAYIAYKFYPEKRAFIGPWSDSYQFLYKLYLGAKNDPEMLISIQKRYNFDISLIRHLFHDTEKILRYLYNSPEWAMVYYDENSVIFLRDVLENAEIIQKYRIDFNGKKLKASDMNIHIAEFFQKIGKLKLAEEAYLKLLEVKPEYLEAGNNLAVIYIDTERYEKGCKLINRFLNYYPKSKELRANLKIAYSRMKIRGNGYEKNNILFRKQ